MYNLSDQQMNVVYRVLAYLGKGIMFSKQGLLNIGGYTNFNFVESRLDSVGNLDYSIP